MVPVPTLHRDADAIENNLFDYIRLFAVHPANDYLENDAMLRFISPIDIPSMQSNSIYKCRFGTGNGADQELNTLLHSYGEKKKPFFMTLSPSSSPEDMPSRLKKNGVSHVQQQAGMCIDLGETALTLRVPDRVRIKRVESDAELSIWLQIYSDGFDYSRKLARYILETHKRVFFDPGIKAAHFLAYYDRRPVATSSVFVAGKTAGIYNVITVPEARKKGIGEAMTVAALQRGIELGGSLGALQATDAGKPVYHKIGFRDACRFDLYMKLSGPSTLGFPFSYVRKRVSNFVRGSFPMRV